MEYGLTVNNTFNPFIWMNNCAPVTPVAALPYQVPTIETILVISSFLLLLNVINNVLDRLIYCGLIGQVLIGVAFGTPGAKWLHNGTEQIIVDLGYLGLILLIYEGSLSTNFRALKANAGLSVLVANIDVLVALALLFPKNIENSRIRPSFFVETRLVKRRS